MSWWFTASREAKLRQVDAGIELGLTARQIALASGGIPTHVNSFANQNGRAFGQKRGKSTADRRVHEVKRARSAYFYGTARPDPDQSDLVTIMGAQ